MDEAMLERVAEKVGRLDLQDHILSWDRKQTKTNPEARRCKNNADHGLLQMRGDGAAIICCATRPQPCTFSEPVSR